MLTKSDRLKKLRIRQRQAAGRPRKEGERNPCGRLKKSETEKDVKSVAIAAVKKIHGIETDGKSGLSGYTLGRMALDGKITDTELAAGNYYAEVMTRYHKSCGMPLPSVRAQNLFAVRGREGEETETAQNRATRAANEMMRLEGLLLRLGDGPRVKQTVRNVCFEDIETLRGMGSNQLAWLKSGLQAIHFEVGLRSNQN